MIWHLIVHLVFPDGHGETKEAAANMQTRQGAARLVVEKIVPRHFPGAVVKKIEAEARPDSERRNFNWTRYD